MSLSTSHDEPRPFTALLRQALDLEPRFRPIFLETKSLSGVDFAAAAKQHRVPVGVARWWIPFAAAVHGVHELVRRGHQPADIAQTFGVEPADIALLIWYGDAAAEAERCT